MRDDEVNFPGNSRMEKEERGDIVPNKAVTKVIKGTVLRKKKDIFDKIAQTFFGDDTKSVGSYILWDVLIPAAKNTISEMVSSGIEMLLFGERRGSSLRRDKNRSIVNYNSIYSRDRGPDRIGRRDDTYIRANHRFDDIILESRSEAEEVLNSLVDLIDQYDQASVSDFYDLIGMSSDFTDNKYGWRNLNRAEVQRVREGYILIMPKPQPLD